MIKRIAILIALLLSNLSIDPSFPHPHNNPAFDREAVIEPSRYSGKVLYHAKVFIEGTQIPAAVRISRRTFRDIFHSFLAGIFGRTVLRGADQALEGRFS